MSNKQWRKPANPDYGKPAVDPSIPRPAGPLSDKEVLGMLGTAARFLHDFVGLMHGRLAQTTPEAVDAECQPEPEGKPRKRTRLVTLVSLGVSASRLLLSILGVLCPEVVNRKPARSENLLQRGERMATRIQAAT